MEVCGKDRGTRASCTPSCARCPALPRPTVQTGEGRGHKFTGSFLGHVFDALHEGLILVDRDKYLISCCKEQWLRDGCTQPSTQRPLLGLFMVEWGNVP